MNSRARVIDTISHFRSWAWLVVTSIWLLQKRARRCSCETRLKHVTTCQSTTLAPRRGRIYRHKQTTAYSPSLRQIRALSGLTLQERAPQGVDSSWVEGLDGNNALAPARYQRSLFCCALTGINRIRRSVVLWICDIEAELAGHPALSDVPAQVDPTMDGMQ